jgi:hypothetical protein
MEREDERAEAANETGAAAEDEIPWGFAVRHTVPPDDLYGRIDPSSEPEGDEPDAQ